MKKKQLLISATLIASLGASATAYSYTQEAKPAITPATTIAPTTIAPTTTIPVEIGEPLVIERTAPSTTAAPVAPSTTAKAKAPQVAPKATEAKPGDDNRDGRIDEDESGWDCANMGNKVCGDPATAADRWVEANPGTCADRKQDDYIYPACIKAGLISTEATDYNDYSTDTTTYCWEIVETDTQPYIFGCTGIDGVPTQATNVAPLITG